MEVSDRESGIVIDGKSYAIPVLESITLDEEHVLYLYADVVVKDFLPSHPDWGEEAVEEWALSQSRKIRNPAFKRALAHIAYRREHPDATDEEIESLLGELNALDLDLAFLIRADDSDPPPTISQNEQDRTNGTSSPASFTDSGRPTENLSESPEETLATSGISASETSSPQSHEIGSES